MKAFFRFINNLDARAVRAAAVAAGLILVLAIGLYLGKTVVDVNAREDVADWLDAMRSGGWGLPAVVVLFVIAAFLGAPQTILIGLVVFAFGFFQGIAYAWIATMTSASVTYAVGRFAGASALERFGGDAVRRTRDFVGANGFTASFVIRLIPSAPFVVINMALGAAGVRYVLFAAGTALGILPKAIVVASIAGGLLEVTGERDWWIVAGLALLAAGWIGVIIIVRSRFKGANS